MSQDKGSSRGRRGRGNTYRSKPKVNFGGAGREVLEGLDESSHIIKQFREYAAELDKKHNKYEKIVKVSRDITIESKRIIFLLHTIDRESKRDTVLSEAEKRLNSVIEVMFKNVALELDGEDPYLFLRAYRAGFQEFIEALTFFHYLKDKTLHDWEKVAESMTYTVKDQSEAASTQKSDIDPSILGPDNTGTQEGDNNVRIQKSGEIPTIQDCKDTPQIQESSNDEGIGKKGIQENLTIQDCKDTPEIQESSNDEGVGKKGIQENLTIQDCKDTPQIQESSNDEGVGKKGIQENLTIQESNNTSPIQESSKDEGIERKVKVLVAPTEYILGIADLTGELMRKCINNLSTGDIDSCFETCNFVRQMYVGFLSCDGICGREVGRKLHTLKQSLTKMENVCYTIKVRGSEIPKHMLADMAMSCAGEVSLDDDEGYQM